MQDDITKLMISCIPRLRRYARALVGDRTDADDLVQDTMERGWGKLSSWRSGSDMRAWLFGIMHNLHIDQVRKPTLHTVDLGDDTPVPVVHATQTHRLEIHDMQSALETLPAELREVLLLVALEEMTYEEVAATLRIPAGTVMSRLSRARERLRAHMEQRTTISPLKVVK
ncbi:RNA polymerase sigma factor [Noviherbaspirillum aerium]|uniref:RNA polymerase sigma factor n=1 Tax=Noviherbaspirillum aerium TaxID=2588497 RepID=UPI00124D5F46|nr:RNA polymerase sigma factor [Noviherbaspirillum aerium]